VLAAIDETRRNRTRVIVVTGRRLDDLRHVLPEVDRCFDAVVAENGAVLVCDGEQRYLADPVEADLEDALTRRQVPIVAGEVLLACDAVHVGTVLEEVERLGLDVQLIRNRAALMIVPFGVGKGSGVRAALSHLGLSPRVAIAVGDAENDLDLLRVCGLGVAVPNAVDSVKAHADVVLDEPDGDGVTRLLRRLPLSGDPRLIVSRRMLVVGNSEDGAPAQVPCSLAGVLIVGGTGRSLAARVSRSSPRPSWCSSDRRRLGAGPRPGTDENIETGDRQHPHHDAPGADEGEGRVPVVDPGAKLQQPREGAGTQQVHAAEVGDHVTPVPIRGVEVLDGGTDGGHGRPVVVFVQLTAHGEADVAAIVTSVDRRHAVGPQHPTGGRTRLEYGARDRVPRHHCP
jgi:hypothetical protein